MKKILLIVLLVLGTVAVGTYLYLRAVTPNRARHLQEDLQENITDEPEQQHQVTLPVMTELQKTKKIQESIRTNDLAALALIRNLYRVNVNNPDVECTPLEYALNYSLKNDPHYDPINMITFLVNYLHADINLLRNVPVENTTLPLTPLWMAISLGVNNKIIEALIDLGADMTKSNKAGYSVLTLALLSNNTELADLLIKKGFNINQENGIGVTTLEQLLFHLAKNIPENEKQYDIPAIKFLLAHGAYANRLNSKGFTPLKLARDFQLDPEVINLLKENAEEYRNKKQQKI